MSKFDELVPERVRSLSLYPPGKPIRQAEKESGVRCIKMASNENPFGPAPRALEAMREAAAHVNLYPENDAPDLRLKLAQLNELTTDEVLVTAGSTSFLYIIARTLLAPGLNAISSERSFIVYPLVTKAAGGRFVTIPMVNDGFDLEAIAEAVDDNTRLVFIANPNNPTGTMVGPAGIERFLDRLPDHVIVVLDEAYSDFAEYFAQQRGVEYSRSLQYVREGRNVVVLRTFSKAHGLAGARVGYGFAPAGLMQYFARMRTVFSVSVVAEAGALAAMEDIDHIRKSLENNASGVQWLTEKLTDMGHRVVPTWANFLYVDVGDDSVAVAKRLQSEGVIVRPLSAWGAPKAIRVTVSTQQQNVMFMAAFKKVMEHAAV